MNKKIRTISKFANVGYVIGCTILFIIAIWIIAYACWNIAKDTMAGTLEVYHLLDEVGLVVFAIAVIDVAKYLLIEEVILRGEERAPEEERHTFSKFAIIIATALFLEGLVLTIEIAKTDVAKIYYPVMVLASATLMIIGLGVYQKLNSSAEGKPKRK